MGALGAHSVPFPNREPKTGGCQRGYNFYPAQTSVVKSEVYCTLAGQKCLNTTKYSCTDCTIYRPNILLGAKMRIETYRYQKFVVLALTLAKIFNLLTFHEVLIY